MQQIIYGLGGFDPSKPNNNILEIIETPEEPTTPDQNLVDTLATLTSDQLAALKAALGL